MQAAAVTVVLFALRGKPDEMWDVEQSAEGDRFVNAKVLRSGKVRRKGFKGGEGATRIADGVQV